MSQGDQSAVETALAQIKADDAEILKLAEAMLRAYDAALYGLDFLAIAALNRCLALSSGFALLIREKNLICAGALLRMHLDTALRFYAGFIVDKPHDFAVAILGGEHVRRMTDKHGRKMTDQYLVEHLAVEYPWIVQLYETTSGYIHMSDTHMFSAFDGVNHAERSVGIKIGATDKELPEQTYLDAIHAFRKSTRILARYIDGWIFTKSNPEMVAAMKAERDAAADSAG